MRPHTRLNWAPCSPLEASRETENGCAGVRGYLRFLSAAALERDTFGHSIHSLQLTADLLLHDGSSFGLFMLLDNGQCAKGRDIVIRHRVLVLPTVARDLSNGRTTSKKRFCKGLSNCLSGMNFREEILTSWIDLKKHIVPIRCKPHVYGTVPQTERFY